MAFLSISAILSVRVGDSHQNPRNLTDYIVGLAAMDSKFIRRGEEKKFHAKRQLVSSTAAVAATKQVKGDQGRKLLAEKQRSHGYRLYPLRAPV
jgi:hypothetical protein